METGAAFSGATTPRTVLAMVVPPARATDCHRAYRRPATARPSRERLTEHAPGLLDPEEVVLVGRLLVGVGRRDHHLVDLELVVEKVEDVPHRLRLVGAEERRVRRDPKAAILRVPDGRYGLVEDALPTDRLVVTLPETVDVDGPREITGGLEPIELPVHEHAVGAEIHVLAPLDERSHHLVDLWVHEGLAAGDRHHRRAALLHGADGIIDGEAPTEDVRRVLDLPASGAGQVAGEERLQLHEERELLPPSEALTRQVGADPCLLTKRDGHGYLTPSGARKWTLSVVTASSSSSSGPSPPMAATTSPTRASGAEAPAVSPTVVASAIHAGSSSLGSSTRWARHPSRSATSTSRLEFDELAEPTTITTSARRATARTASCRFCVA